MRTPILALAGIAVILIVAVGAVVVLSMGGGIDEEKYRQEVRPLILSWQTQMGLDSFECEDSAGEKDSEFTAEDVAVFEGSVEALRDIRDDVAGMDTPSLYEPGVEAMGRAIAHLEAVQADFDRLQDLVEQTRALDYENVFSGEVPTPDEVAWVLRAGGAFAAWGSDMEAWSEFLDCSVSADPLKVSQLREYTEQIEIDLDELTELRAEGPQRLLAEVEPLFQVAELATQMLGRLTDALEEQADVEEAFADVIE